MFSKNPYSRQSRVADRLVFEFLEDRRLLAGDFRAGDSNRDYYFDEADLIQTMKSGKFESGEPATWAEGDWNEDGEYTARGDFVIAFTTGLFQEGPYDSEAGPAVNHLQPLAVTGAAEVTIYYFPESGNVIAIAPVGMTALNLVSRSGSFGGYRGGGLFDVAAATSQFVFDPPSHTWIEHPDLLPIGWSERQVIDDLLVDGAMIGGGGLGNVRLGARENLPADRPDDALVTVDRKATPFVKREEANGLLTYDPQTGDIRIETLALPMRSVELNSPKGFFTGTVGAEQLYIVHAFDAAKTDRFFRTAMDFTGGTVRSTPAMARIYLPGIARTGLSAEEFAAGVFPKGGTDAGSLKLALAIGPSFEECESHLANGAMVGDANLDGQFDTQDLVSIFQAGEYEDVISDNSTWSEGDWTCDGEFDTGDLVAAFQAGNYELPAAAVALRGLGEREVGRTFREVDGAAQMTYGLVSQSDVRRRELVGTRISTNFSSRRPSPDVSRDLATDELMIDLEFLA